MLCANISYSWYLIFRPSLSLEKSSYLFGIEFQSNTNIWPWPQREGEELRFIESSAIFNRGIWWFHGFMVSFLPPSSLSSLLFWAFIPMMRFFPLLDFMGGWNKFVGMEVTAACRSILTFGIDFSKNSLVVKSVFIYSYWPYSVLKILWYIDDISLY